MKRLLCILALAGLAACVSPSKKNAAADAIHNEMDAAAKASAGGNSARTDAAVNNALLPPLTAEMPPADGKQAESRFDIVVNRTPARQVFMAIVSGTRFSMLVHPEVEGNISLNLKDVTVFDALEAIRELYGYDYKVDGTRIYILPVSLQTRIFQVNYLTGLRKGESQLRVSSGSVSDAPLSGTAGIPGALPATAGGARPQDSSRVSMSTSENFWDELSKALNAIVGNEKGRSVVISPMSGVIVVRAMPDELKNVAAYLKASQISVGRQVILEAKIIEVQLSDGFQSGVNWAAFKSNPNSRTAAGQLAAGSTLTPGTPGAGGLTPTPLASSTLVGTPGSSLGNIASSGGTLFGLAFQTSNFAALLNFLESQGSVHVLSSPRIATLNDQKAILKVGTDDFFVTNVSTTTTTGTATTTTPSVTLQPFFSGIALDVTPSIDQNNDIILHVHPSVSQVSTVSQTVDLGSGGKLILPLASSSISETDSIVRAHDGQIVAIGGLMRQAATDDRSGVPYLPKSVFGQTSTTMQKRELVILLKPTVVDSNKDWSDDITNSRDRVNAMKQ